jgi:hypothetical protein
LPQGQRYYWERGGEDEFVYRRKTKLDLGEEFLMDLRIMNDFEEIKERAYKRLKR